MIKFQAKEIFPSVYDEIRAPLTVLLAQFLNWLPIPISLWMAISPNYVLGVLYFWLMNEPLKIQLWFVILIGFIMDFFESSFGNNIFQLTLFYFICKSIRKYVYGQAFYIVFLCFALACGLIQLLNFFLYRSNPEILASQFFLTIFIYVAIHFILSKMATKQ